MANRFLKTAGGAWSAAATWSATGSGGADSVGPPTAADNCILELGSGALTIDTGAVCRSLDMTSGTGSYTGTVTHTAGVTLSIGDGTAGAGNVALKFSPGMTYTRGSTSTCVIAFVSTSTTVQTITTATRSQAAWTFNGAGGSWQLLDTNALGGGSTLTLTAGTLDTNNQTCNWQLFASAGAGTRALTLGTSAVTVTGTAVTAWNVTSTLTLSAASSTITMSGTGNTFTGGSKTYGTVLLTASGSLVLGGVNTFGTLTRTGTAALTDTLSLTGSQTVTGTLTLTGNSVTNRLLVQSNTAGTARTLTADAISLTNVDFIDITGAGLALNAAWTGTSLGDGLGNSNITFDTPVTRFAVVAGLWSATATWSSSSGGVGGATVPLPQDTVFFNALSAAGTYTADMPRMGKDIDFTGFTRSLFHSSVANAQYGNLTLATGMTFTGSQTWIFGGRGNINLTSATKAFGGAVAPGAGATLLLQDDFSGTTLTVGQNTTTAANFDANNNNVTLSALGLNHTSTGILATVTMGSQTWKLTGTGTVWNIGQSSGLTINPNASTIVISDTSVTGKTFIGAGFTYNNLSIAGGGTGAIIVTGANTFNNITGAANAHLTLPSSTTTTINSLTSAGTAGNLFVLDASVAGTAATLSSGNRIGTDFLSVKDNTASGHTPFYAGANGTLVSGTTNWLAQAAPPLGGTLTLMGVG